MSSILYTSLTLTGKIANRCHKEMLLHRFGSRYKDGGRDEREDHFFKALFLIIRYRTFVSYVLHSLRYSTLSSQAYLLENQTRNQFSCFYIFLFRRFFS